MAYVIAEPCVDVKDKACVDECPVDCIYEGPRTLYIDPNECVDCGACEPVCPVEAIFYEDDLPDNWKWYQQVAVDMFDQIGDPGGAADYGPIDHDDPRIAKLPKDINDHLKRELHGGSATGNSGASDGGAGDGSDGDGANKSAE
jgi:NAD-dependent dihydropyrimidine dehydrogenase PreA subunit